MRPVRQYVLWGVVLAIIVSRDGWPGELLGYAAAGDGDNLHISGENARLGGGVDAPEMDQVCTLNGETWHPGPLAAEWLDRLVRGRVVLCRYDNRDRYGRPLVRCSVDGRDVAEEAARAGWVMVNPRYGTQYSAAEVEAKAARRGVWQGECAAPWVWRHRASR